MNDDGEIVLEELVFLGDKHTISSARVLRDDGAMIAPVTIARTGIMLYKASELGDLFKDREPNSIVRVMTTPEVLFDAATIESCRSIPLTITHPKDDVDIKNTKELQKGFLEGMPVPDGTALAGYVVVNDADAIKLVDSGVDQISLGHKSKLERVEGKEWDAEKTTIVANHIAIVRRGRAQTTRIGDSGEEINIVDQATYDALEAKKDALDVQVVELTQKLADAEATRLTDEAINKIVDERAKARLALLVEVAKLGDEFSTEDFSSKSEIEIKRIVVNKLNDKDFKDKSDEYITGRFDDAIERLSDVTLSDALSASILNDSEKAAKEKEASPVDEAKARRKERLEKV